MSGLNLTRERVTKVGKISEASLREDWLAMFDLLKEINDVSFVWHSPRCAYINADDEPQECDCGGCVYEDKIRALIGGE